MTHDVVMLDIDGTLNEAQQPITPEMHSLLQRLARHKQVYFVTGNTYTKSVDLLAGHIKEFVGVWCLNADELRTMRGKLVWQDTETPWLPEGIERTIRLIWNCSARNSIEWRNPRFLNFSKIGRYATIEERKAHDGSWRQDAAGYLKFRYPEVETAIGGAVSVDVYSYGADKSRACKYINATGKNFIYIGDKTEPGGNDHPVKQFVANSPKDILFTSTGPNHTMELIGGIIG